MATGTTNLFRRWQTGLALALILAFVFSTGGLFVDTRPAQAQEGTPPEAVAPDPTPLPELITFSPEAQVSKQPLAVSMSAPGGVIRYTTDGSPPDANSMPYTGPINVGESTVIRAQVFSNEGAPLSSEQTRSYILANYEQTIPVISIAASWTDLNVLHTFPQERGPGWERPMNMEYFAEDGQSHFNVKAGIRIHGNFSRLFSPKKSYRVYFRKSYGGPGNLEYPMFEDSPVTRFDKLVLRAGFQDTFVHRGIPERADRHHTAKYITDQVVRNLHRDMGQPIAHGKWVLLYLNGDFWGLYNLTERIDTQMLRSYSDRESEWDIIVKESGWEEGLWYNREAVRDGDYGAWLENQNWVGSADFTNSGNIGVLEWRVDLENVFSYLFLQAYAQHTDWPSANWVTYRRKDPGAVGHEGQWRMMVWDAEDSFGGGEDNRIDMNTVVKAHSPHDSITRILEKPFIGNCALKHRFVNRSREYLGLENPHNKPETEVGQLSPERVKAEIVKQAEIVRPFIPLETQRWAPDLPGPQLFEQNIQHALNFAEKRGEIVAHHLDILRYQTFTECQ